VFVKKLRGCEIVLLPLFSIGGQRYATELEGNVKEEMHGGRNYGVVDLTGTTCTETMTSTGATPLRSVSTRILARIAFSTDFASFAKNVMGNTCVDLASPESLHSNRASSQ
jgi:hypothetical protein